MKLGFDGKQRAGTIAWITALSGLVASAATATAADPGYREIWRPQYHFSPPKNWINDPNGMVFFDGEYHLFYQHNPSGIQWGNMSWGHALSRDLVHWEHLPLALAEEAGYMIFSGSAVVDSKNTSGFGQGGKPPLVAIFTGSNTQKPWQNQQLAYSNDRGRTWTKYAKNPVLDIGETDFRDPKVFWHEPSRRWIMAVAWPLQHQVRFYASPNLKDWKHLSDFGPAGSISGVWECPDLFTLRLENGNRAEKWVLVVNVGTGAPSGGSGTQYFVGEFDGKRFTLDRSFPKPEPEFVPDGDLVVDFESDDYRGWQATGEAFGSGPAHGKLGDQQNVEGFRGKGFVNSFLNGDKSEGTLTSPEFEISNDYASFLIGGGNNAGKTCFNLLVDGTPVRTATGDNSDRLTWKSWDIRDLRGKKARFEIVDRATGSWGHITLDHIILGDAAVRPATQPALWADFGPDFYAGVTWSDLPRRAGRRVWLGWMSNWRYASDIPTESWRGAMSLPRELTLWQTLDGYRLAQQPVEELHKLREKSARLKNATLAEGNEWLRQENVTGNNLEIDLLLQPRKPGGNFGLKLLQRSNQGTVIRCDTGRNIISLNRASSGKTDFHSSFADLCEAPFALQDGAVRLHLFVDSSSVELFVNDGVPALTALVFPAPADRPVELWSSNDTLTIKEMNVWRIRPITPILQAKEH